MQQYRVLFHNSRGVNGFAHPQKSEITHQGAKNYPEGLHFIRGEHVFTVFPTQLDRSALQLNVDHSGNIHGNYQTVFSC